MAGLVSQNKRLFSFRSPLGDKLLCNSMEGTEAVSKMFEFKLELASEDFGISWEKMLGKNVTLGIRNNDGEKFRYFNGHISHFAPLRHDGRLAYYSATMVPWCWFLTLTQDCLVYQEKTVEEVIRTTFTKFGFQQGKHFRFELKHKDWHTPWENCCQYRETSFSFVSRLMEIEGMYYFFEHTDDKHTMVIVDDKTSHVPCPLGSAFRYEHNLGAGLVRAEPTIFASEMLKMVRPASYFHKDFNFKEPDNPLGYGSDENAAKRALEMLEIYDYPGEFEKPVEGMDWSRVRQESQEHDRTESKGRSNSRALTPGYRFKMTEHNRDEQNIDYLVTSVTHTAHEGSLLPGTDAGTASYENRFESIPSERQYRPRRKTPLHRMQGSQTAIVVGPKGEDIHTDQFGRVRVKFHWDRGETRPDNSCWIRVMQPWAGPGYGHWWLPRIGQEVIVDFLEGDPDRPIITGCVYNAKNRQPYQPLPEKKNWSGIKSRSTIGGTDKNYNELRFIDTKGQELYAMHAEKDMEITVNHDTNEVVDHDRSLQVKNDQFEVVDRDKNSTVKRHKREQVDGDKHNTVKGEFREEIDKDMSLRVKGEIQEKADQRFLLESGGDVHIKAGGRIILEAADGILFLGKGAFIDVTDQVVIEGSRILLNCGVGAPGGATAAKPQVPGAASFMQNLFSQLPAVPDLPMQPEVPLEQALASNPFVAGVLPGAAAGAGIGSTPSAAAITSMLPPDMNPSDVTLHLPDQSTMSLSDLDKGLPAGVNPADLQMSLPDGQKGPLDQILSGLSSAAQAAVQSLSQVADDLGITTHGPSPGAPSVADQLSEDYAGPDEPDVLA